MEVQEIALLDAVACVAAFCADNGHYFRSVAFYLSEESPRVGIAFRTPETFGMSRYRGIE
jgi:hypothetical protein